MPTFGVTREGQDAAADTLLDRRASGWYKSRHHRRSTLKVLRLQTFQSPFHGRGLLFVFCSLWYDSFLLLLLLLFSVSAFAFILNDLQYACSYFFSLSFLRSCLSRFSLSFLFLGLCLISNSCFCHSAASCRVDTWYIFNLGAILHFPGEVFYVFRVLFSYRIRVLALAFHSKKLFIVNALAVIKADPESKTITIMIR